jgi:hypothetical protein
MKTVYSNTVYEIDSHRKKIKDFKTKGYHERVTRFSKIEILSSEVSRNTNGEVYLLCLDYLNNSKSGQEEKKFDSWAICH